MASDIGSDVTGSLTPYPQPSTGFPGNFESFHTTEMFKSTPTPLILGTTNNYSVSVPAVNCTLTHTDLNSQAPIISPSILDQTIVSVPTTNTNNTVRISGAEEDDDDEGVANHQIIYGVQGLVSSEDPDTILDSTDQTEEVDRRSVFVGNVDYGTTPPELQEHFKNSGAINRITIMVDRYTGHPKGYAYIEFQEESAISNAVALNQSVFRDRPLKVIPKRKNIPGYSMLSRGGATIAPGSRGTPIGAIRGGFGRGYSGRGVPRGRGVRGTFSGYFPRYRGRGQRPRDPY